MNQYDLIFHMYMQRKWSEKTFGPGTRTNAVLDHVRKELVEIEAAPQDLEEWIDLILLGIDGAWRAGYSPEQIAAELAAKLVRNMNREWPDWRTADPDKAIEHIKKAGYYGHASDCDCAVCDDIAFRCSLKVMDIDLEKQYAERLGRLAQLCDVVCPWVIGNPPELVPVEVAVASAEIMEYVDAVRL